jgi:Tfp pilus assembly PilM family ATPase
MGRMVFESKVLVAFDESAVRGAIVSRGPRGPRVAARAQVPLSPGALVASALDDNLLRPDEVREALARLYRELGGNGRRAALVLPDGIARLLLLDVPAQVRPAEFARFRLAQGLPYAAAEALVDGLAAPPGRFLAAAVRRSVVRGYEASAEAAGFAQDRVDLLPLVALAPFLLRPDAALTALAVVLGDAAFSMAYFDGGQLALFRSRRRDGGHDEYQRLRDEITRTAALAGCLSAPRVLALGADAPELAAALRAEGFDASSGRAGSGEPSEAAWLGAVLA